MQQPTLERPLLRIALRPLGCLGLGAVAYLLLLLPPGAGITSWVSDKVGHVAVGFALALSLHAIFFSRSRMFVLLVSIALSALSEFAQQFVGRNVELLDLVADTGGALAYVSLAAVLARLWR